jgi:hypothetical protein
MTDPDEAITSRDEWLDDGWLLLRLHVHSHHLDFESYRVTSVSEDGAIGYESRDATRSDDAHVPATDGARRFVHGTVGWDGCSHVYFGDGNEEGYLHLCGRGDWDALRRVLDRAWAVASSEVPSFDAETAGT